MFLDTGRSPDSFWDLSIAEVIDCLEAHNRQIRQRNHEQEAWVIIQAQMMYNQALQISNMVGTLLSNDARIVPLSEYYPDLFDRPEIKERKQQAELSQYLADMRAFAERHNRRLEQEGGESDGSGYDAGEIESAD